MAADDVPCCEPMFWTYLAICVALVAFAGLMSGLTLGLMSLSLVDLEVISKAGQPRDRENAGWCVVFSFAQTFILEAFNAIFCFSVTEILLVAEKILPIVKNQHLLLCTLLICNAMAMEALPIFVDSLLSEWCSILLSVTLILAFGEIIPQAVCSRYGLSVGAKLSGFVRLLVIVFFPLSYPISKLLDLLLGKGHSALLRRAELKMLVDMHGNEAGKGGELTHDETTIISGALDLTQKTAKDAMTPMSEVFSLDLNAKLTDETISLLMSKGHSRVPVYSGKPTNIIGVVLVKNLIKCRAEDETPVRDLTIRRIPRVHDCSPLYDILNQFQKGHSHMAVVVNIKRQQPKSATAKHDLVKINPTTNSTQIQAEEKGIKLACGHNKNMHRDASPVASSHTEIQSPALAGTIKKELTESLSNSDEEIIGIITMEDVLEELLQVLASISDYNLGFSSWIPNEVSKEPIYDETDEYVDVHNRIKINMLPSKIASVRSPKATYLNWRTSMASPLSSSQQTPASSCHHTPVLRSPITPYIQSPFARPTLSASPGRYKPYSPADGPVSSSPSSHRLMSVTLVELAARQARIQVSRKPYEKLPKP
ncbi:hypothetical protein RJ640_023115 [Escallonia rubra]|uniref:CNNM transmembrane domain-containing protein n=1 Tax=Escallonia rubra TaxID=112253 RepID=A0AA88UIQ3_9ASTE|nr:hypothetical protein RJ640_023115 [Escallonia rubra]